ncbi:MAG: hypothetical protein P8Y47_11620 [Alphaproteobacteria bacterium]
MARKINLPSKYDGRTSAAKRLAAIVKALSHEFRVAHGRSPSTSELLSIKHLASLDTHRHEIEREVDAGTRPRTSAVTQQIISIADAIRREREGIGLTAPASKAPQALAIANANANANAASSSKSKPYRFYRRATLPLRRVTEKALTASERLALSAIMMPPPVLHESEYDRRLTPEQFRLEWKENNPRTDKIIESYDLNDFRELCISVAAEYMESYQPSLAIPTTRPGMDSRVWMQAQMLVALISDKEDPAEVELAYDLFMQEAPERRARIRRAERKRAHTHTREKPAEPLPDVTDDSEKLFDDIQAEYRQKWRLDTTLPDVAEGVQSEYAQAKAEQHGGLVRARLSEEDKQGLYDLYREIVTGLSCFKPKPWRDPDRIAFAQAFEHREEPDHDIDYDLMYQRR